MDTLLIVLGTRPESVKLFPVIQAAASRGLPYRVLHTGQQATMLGQLDLLAPTGVESLQVPYHADPFTFADRVSEHLSKVVTDPCTIVCQGDTSSAYGASQFASSRKWPLVHIEAGLRSGDDADPYPEELFRKTIDRLATHRFAPTHHALANLTREGLSGHVVGNTVIDALRLLDVRYVPPASRSHSVLVTLHRRESWGGPILHILRGMSQVASRHQGKHGLLFTWPVHPSVHLSTQAFQLPGNVLRVDPMDYPRFIRTLAVSKAVLTDSGGIVEEACALGIPCVIARDHTERPESVMAGKALLAGRTEQGIIDALDKALSGSLDDSPSTLYGDGHTSETLLAHLSG